MQRQCLEVIGSWEMTVPGSKWQSRAVTVAGNYWDSGNECQAVSDRVRKWQCLVVI